MLLGDSLPLLSVGHTLSVIRDPFQNSLEEHLVGMSVLWDWKGRRDVGGFGSHRRNRLALRIMKHLARNLRDGTNPPIDALWLRRMPLRSKQCVPPHLESQL